MSSHAIPHLLGTPHCFQNPCWLGPIPILADFPIFGNEIPKNSLHLAVKSPKITKVLKNPPKFCYELTKKNNIRAHFQTTNPRLQPGGESSWLPAETAEVPVDQLLPSLCKSWANLGRFQQFRSLR